MPRTGQRMLAQLICDEEPTQDPGPFDPRRFALRHTSGPDVPLPRFRNAARVRDSALLLLSTPADPNRQSARRAHESFGFSWAGKP